MRLFNPLPDNPLHGGNSQLSSEGMLVDGVPAQQSILTSHAVSLKNHHGVPLPQFQTTAINTPVPPMKLIPAFLLVPLGQVEQPGMVPVIPCISGLPTLSPPTLSPPPRSNLEIITRANLVPLMLSKGIVSSPASAIPPARAMPQSHNLISSHPQHTQQLPSLFSNTFSASSFPSNQVTIQVAQPPVLQNIGNNNNSNDSEHLFPARCTDNSNTPANHSDTGNVAVPQSTQKQLHRQAGLAHHPFTNPKKKKSLARRHFCGWGPNSPYQQKTSQFVPKKAKFNRLTLVEWKNSLTRFWFLMERGQFSEKEHPNLIHLFSEMNKNKNHPDITLEGLKQAKVVEILEKFNKEESLFRYDPLIRKMASSILQSWSRKFPIC